MMTRDELSAAHWAARAEWERVAYEWHHNRATNAEYETACIAKEKTGRELDASWRKK